ncbi:extracellular solute-binding protein [Polyangium sorediatum]|uniref:Extracellular solute-binding protein n=1 Tax=Polyangium sorediatum TaxID=889274 RepID=A0ABT6NU15_9BACT|nr:extracellular solute-binding protein [Polyangium sorediatum]MDI1431826.1 extracellular solute-binding protein [Polyangium sorediatum]
MKSTQRRRFPAFGVFFALFVVVFFSPAAQAEPIRLWHAQRGDEQKALEEIVARFRGERVELLALPSDAFKSKVSAAVQFGEGPDLFLDAHDKLGDYDGRKVVAPVGDALDRDAFAGPTLAAVSLHGEPYGVPITQKSVALYVNTDLVKDLPADLESIAALGKTLPAGVVPLAYNSQSTYYHAGFVHAFGGLMLTPGDQFGFVGPAAEKSLDFVLDLRAQKVVAEDTDVSVVTNLFRSGKAAFAIDGPWLATSLADAPSLHYRVAPLPLVRAAGKPLLPYLGVEAVMLTPKGATRPEVRALARLLASPEATRIRLERARTLPARIDVPLPPEDAFLAAFAEQAKSTVAMPSSLAMNAVWEPSDRAIRKVLRRDALPSPALSEAKRRFDDVRRPSPPPASRTPGLVVFGALLLLGALSLVRRAKDPEFRKHVKRSLPAYAYVTHAVIAVGVLVVLPLVLGALTSLLGGSIQNLKEVGWHNYVGLENFVQILTARGGSLLSTGSFYVVLLVTVLWTVINVFFHVAIGVALALLLSRPLLRLRALYRVLLIIPWAVPSYVTALAWKGMFHRQFGAVTGLVHALNDTFGTSLEPISWFARFSTAFAANVATNVWLGFPFMMVVTIGALTAVPDDVLEAAKVDGASRWQRLWLVTLPMIRPSLLPAVTMGAVWTFNMFNVVFLVSGGEPDGTTEILVTEAYRWAFTRNAQYGYAAAYAVLIFLLLFGRTRISDWFAERREAREKAASAAAIAKTAGGAA